MIHRERVLRPINTIEDEKTDRRKTQRMQGPENKMNEEEEIINCENWPLNFAMKRPLGTLTFVALWILKPD